MAVGRGVAIVYFSNNTYGSQSAPNPDFGDVFVAKISDVPEPGSLALMTLGAAMLWVSRRRRNRQPRSGAMA